jgi:hypothetical protein
VVDKEWNSYLQPLAPMGKQLSGYLTDPKDTQLRHEMYRDLFSAISLAYIGVVWGDPQHPDFMPYTTQSYAALANNPDNVYYFTPIEDAGVYRISGFRGTVKRIDFQIGAGRFIPYGEVDDLFLGRTLANYDIDEHVTLGKDGSFSVILSAERPAGYTGDWWPLGKGASNVFLRQISYDWINEVDGRLDIERLDTAAVRPRASAKELDKDFRQIARWVEDTVTASAKVGKSLREQFGTNNVQYKDLSAYSPMLTQRYAYAMFDLKPDEGLLIEAKVPECRYWSIHLFDDFAYILDWMNRQTNLNGFTAQIDKDGVFRTVISSQDPGIPNWLDAAGYKTGGTQVRWEKCSEWPQHKATLIKIADVRKYLPSDTPVVTPAQREEDVRLRRKGAQMRKRW